VSIGPQDVAHVVGFLFSLLIKAELTARVRHHVALPIAGCDRTPENAYFTAEVAQES
jgi:hypothetical protein